MIKVRYESIDSYGRGKTRSFKTLAGAQKFAQYYVGASPEMGGYYAVSGDGVGKITVSGASLSDLFPATVESQPYDYDEAYAKYGLETPAMLKDEADYWASQQAKAPAMPPSEYEEEIPF